MTKRDYTDEHVARHAPAYEERGWSIEPKYMGVGEARELFGFAIDCGDGRLFTYGFNPDETEDHLLGRMLKELDIVTEMDRLERAHRLDDDTKARHVERLMALSRGED